MVNHICCFPNLKLCIGGISSTWFSCTIVFILCDSIYYISVCSVAQSCPTPCDPMNHSMPGLPVHHQLPESTQIHVHQVSDAINHLIFYRPLLFCPSIFPSIRVFSNESALDIRQPKYLSFSFNISPSNEHPGLISFRMDWLDLPAVQGTPSLLQNLCPVCFHCRGRGFDPQSGS